jgi:hypothetical protein
VLDYTIEWSPRLTYPDTITSSEWFVPEGLVGGDEEIYPAGQTSIWLSSGDLGAKYEVLNRVTTLEGRVMDQTVALAIKTK